MNRKIVKSNGCVIGGYSTWHYFIQTLSQCAIGIGLVAAVSIIVFIATLPLWM